ncbi:sensor histidine kinase [Virgifigura deserti]|uniref:sensor histidine kinase n=1 Tax=Virgifigura deserti TaxID=2268457 RepID=UPI003CCBEAFA
MPTSSGEKRKKPTLTLAGSAVIVAFVVIASGLGVALFIGRDLLQIRELATHTRSEVIPFAVAEAERALDAERLGRYAETVVLSRDVDMRRKALATANDLARRLGAQLPDAEKETLNSAIVAVRAAARHNNTADELTARINETLLASDLLVEEAKEIVEGIAAESSTELEQAIDDLIEYSTTRVDEVADGSESSAYVIGRLEERTASLPTINETSNRLLMTLGLMRATLLSLPSAEDDAMVKERTESYETLSNRLQVMLVLLGGQVQSDRLARLIRDFKELSEVFPLQTLALAQRRLGRREGTAAIEALSALTKRLSTDADRIATTGIEGIEARIGQIMSTALIGAVFLVGLASILTLIGRREVLVPLTRATRALDALRGGGAAASLPRARLYELDALIGSLESLRDATLQINEHTRKLSNYAKELERSNSELEQFAYVASHDLQEPLRMISSYCQLLQRRYKEKLDGDAEEFIGFAVEGAARMQRLINDLLAYSRVGTRGKPFEDTDCNDVLDAALSNLQTVVAETRAQIAHDPLPRISGDPVQLTQLFQNLIANAIKFRKPPPDEVPVAIQISAVLKDGDWVFSVRDNGIGIDPQYSERIFIIFQRLHDRSEYAGTGIGLAICKKIVERHGGRIWVDSAPGSGSTFYFTIPETARLQ